MKGDDLLKNLALSHNLSEGQVKVLEDWVEGGGILWIESAVFVSSYDYSLNRLDQKKIEHLIERLRAQKLFGHPMRSHVLRAKRIDEFNMEKVQKEIRPDGVGIPTTAAQDDMTIRRLLLEQTDYVGIYLSVDGTPILRDASGVYASYINHGKGKVITLAPLDFRNSYYDGELFRLSLLLWALDERK